MKSNRSRSSSNSDCACSPTLSCFNHTCTRPVPSSMCPHDALPCGRCETIRPHTLTEMGGGSCSPLAASAAVNAAMACAMVCVRSARAGYGSIPRWRRRSSFSSRSLSTLFSCSHTDGSAPEVRLSLLDGDDVVSEVSVRGADRHRFALALAQQRPAHRRSIADTPCRRVSLGRPDDVKGLPLAPFFLNNHNGIERDHIARQGLRLLLVLDDRRAAQHHLKLLDAPL